MNKPNAAEQVERSFAKKADRADLLAPGSAAAEGPLRFAAMLLRAQGRCAASIAKLHEAAPLAGQLEVDAPRLLPEWNKLLAAIAEQGPELLAGDATARLEGSADDLVAGLGRYWRRDAFDYCARALLRPYVEALGFLGIVPDRAQSGPEASALPCPFCGGAPIMAMRRAGAEGDGAPRFLVCGLCAREQPITRIHCAGCGELDPHKMPGFKSDQHANASIECCDTCRKYTKSIDLSLDARPIPEVDDLLTISLDLWAAENKWTRVEPGLAGL